MGKQWETRRRLYRVWEANRKVLLYPENWIRPELRDDKSPFFRDLENALLQNEKTDDTVETAYRRYLEQLSEVARLDIVGIHAERDGETDIVHVFGRTPGTPHRHFYRRQIDSSYWTAWERVDLDIEGDHLMPVVWNRRHVPVLGHVHGKGWRSQRVRCGRAQPTAKKILGNTNRLQRAQKPSVVA